jgi:hypothetical protein
LDEFPYKESFISQKGREGGAGEKQPVHWYLENMVAIIKQGTNLWVSQEVKG